MDNTKISTDIDRKLAIYYHPLFQEVIKVILQLFNNQNQFQIGLPQFIEFNLKLQKSLLPSFDLDNAIISALNDWVKQVAECLSYQGMVSTNKCQQITENNFQNLLKSELNSVSIDLFANQDQYIKTMMKNRAHDAFKLLGVRINRQVFNKFMFDLCSTWCQFLDVELFVYFLVGILLQISQGDSFQNSKFKSTTQVFIINLQYMEKFENIKNSYSKNKRKQLRYYRAWCQWNYLRVNEVGQGLIMQLDQTNPEDQRILQLANIFQRAINTINDEITNQNKQSIEQSYPALQQPDPNNQQFLIMKQLNVKKSDKQIEKYNNEHQQQIQIKQKTSQIGIYQNFEIQIDQDGNMFLKRIVKLPILGTKIIPQVFKQKKEIKKFLLNLKKQQYRQISNLYRRIQPMKVRLQHNLKNDYYFYRKKQKIIQRDSFYKQKEYKIKSNNQHFNKIIHNKIQSQINNNINQKINLEKQKNKQIVKQINNNKILQQKQSVHKNINYIHKVIAPTFLTDNHHNASYSVRQGSIYGLSSMAQRRNLKMGLPKLKHMDKHQKINSYHFADNIDINNKSTDEQSSLFIQPRKKLQGDSEKQKIQKQIVQQSYIWKRYISEQQMQQLTNYEEFYTKIQMAKKSFGNEFQSQYRINLKPILLYDNKRYQMGGIINKLETNQFYNRIKKLINRQNRKIRRKKYKNKLKQYKQCFKDNKNKKLYQDIFIDYHLDQLKNIKLKNKEQIKIKQQLKNNYQQIEN